MFDFRSPCPAACAWRASASATCAQLHGGRVGPGGQRERAARRKRPEPLHRAHGIQGHARTVLPRATSPRRWTSRGGQLQRLHQQGMHLLLRQGDRRRASRWPWIFSPTSRLRPAFDAGELDKERGVVLEEIAMVDDTPEDLVHDLLAEAQYRPDRSARRSWAPRHLHPPPMAATSCWATGARHYVPGKLVVAIAGNYDWDAFLDAGEPVF